MIDRSALLQAQPWLHDPEIGRALDALAKAGIDARFVGGCVRDALLGKIADDVDIAVDAPPETVIHAIAAVGIRSVPTGLDHGTVTIVLPNRTVEATSLRHDVETDGRRAVVAYTDDWREDSLRRDFTINALYADRAGGIMDFHGGLADLDSGRLRFIGNADDRIDEDYLRIIRFFRFHAQLSLPDIDPDGLAACARRKSRLTRLSAERVAKELMRLLQAPNPAPVVAEMIAGGFLDDWLPEAADTDGLARLCPIEDGPDPLRRLAALCPVGAEAMGAIAARLKLSGHDRDRLMRLSGPVAAPADAEAVRRLIYRLGPETARDRAIIELARGGEPAWEAMRSAASDWPVPVFPLTGRDALDAGMAPGPAVGDLLCRLEQIWIDGDFSEDRAALLARLKRESGQ